MRLRTFIVKPLFLGLFLFLMALVTRTLWLDKIPIGITHDNMIFALNSRAVYFTGSDVTGKWHPLSFSPIPDEPAQAELIYTLLAPTNGMLPSSLFSAHIFNAVVNAFFVLVLFFLSVKLLGKWPAFIIGLVACFNPWNIFFARSAFEASLVVFFYIAGLYVLIITNGWKKLWTIIPLALGFYTYMAYKTTFIPYVAIISFFVWNYIDHRKYTKQYGAFLFIILGIFASFLLNLKTQSTGNRLREASFVSIPAMEKEVNAERQNAIRNPLTTFISNKPVVIGKTIVSKYVGAFSASYLFIDNEWTQRFHLYKHGYFYYLDAVFLVIGFCYLFAYKRTVWILVTAVILIAPIPSVISTVDTSYAMRSSLYFPFFYIIIGSGIWYVITLFKRRKIKHIVAAVLIGAYGALIINFLYGYFFIQPILGAEGAAFSARVVSKFTDFTNKENKKTVVVLESPKALYKDFIYYSNNYNAKTTTLIRSAFLNKKYEFQNISFQKCSTLKEIDKNTIFIFDPGEKCLLFKGVNSVHTIAQLSDSGRVYSIYQDSLCSEYSLKPYISGLTMQDFDFNTISKQKFCEDFIINYR